MTSVYQEILRRRPDMTEWLVHSTRDSATASAREILRSILVEGVLRPGFAPRGTVPRHTIYGRVPAVCFSEQPLSMLLEYLTVRNDPSALAGYGVLIHKHDVYAAGGLPVIYGLRASSELRPGEPGFDPAHRSLNPANIPMSEQFRYVAFAPNRGSRPLDWSHEREWRWPSTEAGSGVMLLGEERSSSVTGAFKARVHAFVRHDTDVAWLRRELQESYERDQTGKVNEMGLEDYSVWWRLRLPRMRVLSLETVERELAAGNRLFARYEDVPQADTLPLVTP